MDPWCLLWEKGTERGCQEKIHKKALAELSALYVKGNVTEIGPHVGRNLSYYSVKRYLMTFEF